MSAPTPTKEAFLPNDIVSVLSTILQTHIDDARQSFILQHRNNESDKLSRPERKRPKFRGKFTKKKDMLESSAEEEEGEGQGQNDDADDFVMPPLSYFCLPYAQLIEKFHLSTGHGWTSSHLELYGPLKTFLLQHSQTFLLHLTSDRVGLVAAHDRPAEFLAPQYDAQGKRTFQHGDDAYFDNDLYRITSPHLYTHLSPPLPSLNSTQSIASHELHFRQYLSIKSGKPINPRSTSTLSPQDELNTAYTPISTINRANHPHPSRPHINLSSLDSASTTIEAPKSKSTTTTTSPRTGFDHHEMEEKMRNRGCAPQAQSNIKLPIYLIFLTLFLIIVLGALLHNNTIQPQQFGDASSQVVKLAQAYQRFVKTFVKDLTGQ